MKLKIVLVIPINLLKLKFINISVGGFEPLGTAAALHKSRLCEEAYARLIIGGNGAMELMKMQKTEAIISQQLQTLAGIALVLILAAMNHYPHRCTLMIGVEIEQIGSADGFSVGLQADDEPELLVGIDIVLSVRYILLDGKPRIRHKSDSVAPNRRVVLAIVEKVDVLGFNGAENYLVVFEHQRAI